MLHYFLVWNWFQIIVVVEQLVSAKDASLRVKFNTKDWKSGDLGEQLAGPVPPLPAGFGEPGVALLYRFLFSVIK